MEYKNYNTYTYKNKEMEDNILTIKLKGGGNYEVEISKKYSEEINKENFLKILNDNIDIVVKNKIPLEDIELSSSNTDTDTPSKKDDINPEKPLNKKYEDFGLEDEQVYGYIVVNTMKKSEKTTIKLIDWNAEDKNYMDKFKNKESFLKELNLYDKNNGIAIIPFGQTNSEHWVTMIIDLKNKNIYVFDSTKQNFKNNNALKTSIFGNLSNEIIPINDYEIQSEKAGTCGIWTMLLCSEIAKYDSIYDILKICKENNKITLSKKILENVSRKGYNIVDKTRIDARYNGKTPENYKSYFYKEEVLEKELNKEEIELNKEYIKFLDKKNNFSKTSSGLTI